MKTPCINVCQMDPARGVCIGCCRSLDEIANWGSLSEAERERVLETLAERREKLKLPLISPA